MSALKFWLTGLGAGAFALMAPAQTYSLVQGLDKFDGSTAAWHLLETNGFVVTDPSFKHIYTPYLDGSIPFFITTDSAWHTYRVLLDEGMREMEAVQTPRLADFSRLLLAAANEQAKSDGQDFDELARYAAVGLALQDKTFRQSLPDEQKALVEALLSGQGEVQPEIGSPLWAPDFHAAGGKSSEERAGYLAAWQWYATVIFRRSDPRETRLALGLSWLLMKEPALWQVFWQLRGPWFDLYGPLEGYAVENYWGCACEMLGTNFTLSTLLKSAPALQSRVSHIDGLYLLPPHRPPGAARCFNLPDPKVPGRTFYSGLDFFVATPELRSPAALRALEAAEGKDAAEVLRQPGARKVFGALRTPTGSFMESLKPLPVRVGPALRSEAWADAQLWSELGCWADENLGEPSRNNERVNEAPSEKPAAGVVAPYPKFFTYLGECATAAATLLEKQGVDEPFDARTAARELLECVLWQEGMGARTDQETERMAGPMDQFNRFTLQYGGSQPNGRPNNPGIPLQVVSDLEALARRCSNQTAPADDDRQVLLKFFEAGRTVPAMLRNFATVCDRLAELARKHLEGTALTDDDLEWIGDYGATLEEFLSSAGEDFPMVNQVQADPARKTFFCEGLGWPEALYIILPDQGRLRLYRGAVLTYREFASTNATPLDDASWRALVQRNEAPPPAFTGSFRVERDAADLIKSLTENDADAQGYKDLFEAMEELQSRVTDRDLPALLAALGKNPDGLANPVADGIARAVAKVHWEPRQRELFALMETNDGGGAPTIAPIFLQRTEGIDGVFLSTNFEHAPARARRVYCALLSRVPQTDQTRSALLRALSDPAPGVRWEAATVIGGTTREPSSLIAPLLERLSDKNEYVAAIAATDLGRIHATNVAPAILTNLEARLEKPEPTLEDLRKENEAVRDFPLNSVLQEARPMRNGAMAFDLPRVRRFGGGLAMRLDEAPAASAMIEALGDLRYQPAEERIFGLLDGPYALSAGKALKQLAPDKLARRLVMEAFDKKADGPTRDRALVMLATPPVSGSVAELVPLLDDTTIVPGRRPMPGREWRICDRAAETISTMLGRPVKIIPMQTTDQRDQQIEQIRQMLKAEY